MSEEVVPYRTRNSTNEFLDLGLQIKDAMVEAAKRGIHPTEVWLGRRELEIFDAGPELDTGIPSEGFDGRRRTILGLVVRGSMEQGVRVGQTISLADPQG